MRTNPYQAPEAVLDDEPSPRMSDELDSFGEILTPLKQTRPWVKLVSVAMLLGAAFLLLFGLVVLIADVAKIPTGLGVVYVLLGGVYVVPSLHLWRYASSIQRVMRSREVTTLAEALEHQRKFWHFVGVLTLLVLALYALGFLAAIFIGLSGRHL